MPRFSRLSSSIHLRRFYHLKPADVSRQTPPLSICTFLWESGRKLIITKQRQRDRWTSREALKWQSDSIYLNWGGVLVFLNTGKQRNVEMDLQNKIWKEPTLKETYFKRSFPTIHSWTNEQISKNKQTSRQTARLSPPPHQENLEPKIQNWGSECKNSSAVCIIILHTKYLPVPLVRQKFF